MFGTSGELFITASSAIGGAGSGFPFSGSAVITGSLLVSGSGLIVTGSLGVLGSVSASSFTGTLLGTASTASYFVTSSVTSASFATSASQVATSSYADNFTVANQLTATTLIVQTISSSVVYSSGSNIFGNNLNNTQKFTGSVEITGSLLVKGPTILSGSALITGSLGVGTTGSAVIGRIDASNDVVAFSTSDENLKKNIKPIENALEKIEQIGGYNFEWKEDKNNIHGFSGQDVGVIAQEIESILPEVVTTRDNGYKAVKYEKIVPLLIQCIKELKDEIRDLKSQK